MALKNVSQLKDSIAGLLSGIDLNQVDNLNGALERACRVLMQKADVPEASGIQNITLYSGVYDYACDTRIFGTAINDIRPQGISRNYSDITSKTDQETFDRTKKFYYPSGTMSTFQYSNGVPIIRITAPFPKQQIIINQMNEIGALPTQWVASGTASGLAVDATNFYESPASLRFNITTGAGILTKALSSQLSMASYEDIGVAFLAIQIPTGATASNLTNISLKLGSDSTNYNSVTSINGFLGSWIAGEWLLVPFDFSTASQTGTPDWSTIDYVQVTLTVAGNFTNFHIGGLFMSLPSPAQILYQSAAIFLPTGSTVPLTTITADTDTIILNDPAYTLYEYEGASSICQQTGGTAGSAMIQTFKGILEGQGNDIGLYARFRGDNPSQELRMVSNYYDNSPGYNQRS